MTSLRPMLWINMYAQNNLFNDNIHIYLDKKKHYINKLQQRNSNPQTLSSQTNNQPSSKFG